jgi:hypothetical protein
LFALNFFHSFSHFRFAHSIKPRAVAVCAEFFHLFEQKVIDMKPIYFCFGDFRNGEKQYRIFKVRSIQDAYDLVSDLGYEIILDNCMKDNSIPDVLQRNIVAIHETMERKFHEIENVVACYRHEYAEAQRMKRHFFETDMSEYFPKILDQPEECPDLQIQGTSVRFLRRSYPWITEYWTRQYRPQQIPPYGRIISPNMQIMQAASLREKREH